jgi:hypothetical protein
MFLGAVVNETVVNVGPVDQAVPAGAVAGRRADPAG